MKEKKEEKRTQNTNMKKRKYAKQNEKNMKQEEEKRKKEKKEKKTKCHMPGVLRCTPNRAKSHPRRTPLPPLCCVPYTHIYTQIQTRMYAYYSMRAISVHTYTKRCVSGDMPPTTHSL